LGTTVEETESIKGVSGALNVEGCPVLPMTTVSSLSQQMLLDIFLILEDDFKSWDALLYVCKDWYAICKRYRDVVVKVEGEEVLLYKHNGNFYIPLIHCDGGYNVSRYKYPNGIFWRDRATKEQSDVITYWYKLRFDPHTLMIHNGDFTFSKSAGYVAHHLEYSTRCPYGTCFDCENFHSHTGRANIDLRGTQFAVDDAFQHRGWQSNGTWAFSNNNQVVQLTGGGYCGWTAPINATTEDMAHAGGWFLKLKLLQL